MIKAVDIHKQFGELEVLCGIDLEIASSEIVSITGPSGAGKSTLLQILGSLDKPSQGQVFLNQTEISALSKKELANFRNQEIGFIFQFQLLRS